MCLPVKIDIQDCFFNVIFKNVIFDAALTVATVSNRPKLRLGILNNMCVRKLNISIFP
jgi:hypothetical protein